MGYIDELERLKAEKREIEKKIKELKENPAECGRVKFHKTYGRLYTISILKERGGKGYDMSVPRWYSVTENTDKKHAINDIDILIKDLQGLKNKLGGE